MARDPSRCFKCNCWLLSEDELETNCCENCAEKMYRKYQERQEWDYYHPTEGGNNG